MAINSSYLRPAFIFQCMWLTFFVRTQNGNFRSSFYSRVLEANNLEPSSNILADHHACDSLPDCASICLNNILCRSFFYNPVQERCILTPTVNVSTLRSSPGFLYFITTDCIRSKAGWNYNGNIHQTKSGRLCQRWDQQSPHTHSYQDLSDQHNFCRNTHLDRVEEEGPWCFTMDSDKRWESCGLPPCYDFSRNCKTTQNGADYYGTTDMTQSGDLCKNWSDTTNQNHSYTFLSDQFNFCRNPFGKENAPWCYTGTSWDYCNISQC